MKFVKQWLKVTPVDTLFFKGSEPMVAGENHEAQSMFPPMPTTLLGALRSAILGQRNIEPAEYLSSEPGVADRIMANYPLLGTPGKAGFKVFGPLIWVERDREDCFFPAPAHWFTGDDPDGPWVNEISVVTAEDISPHLQALRLMGSVTNPPWILEPKSPELKGLHGWWANKQAVESVDGRALRIRVLRNLQDLDPEEPCACPPETFYAVEPRTGIAMDYGTRRVHQGYLYTFRQIRLRQMVHLLVGLSENLVPGHLDAAGILQLGGERRLATYEQSKGPALQEGNGPWISATNPIEAEVLEQQFKGLQRISGPLLRTAGWDMRSRFHKPVTTYFPAGTSVLAGQLQPCEGFIRV